MPRVGVSFDHSFEYLFGNNLNQNQVFLKEFIISLQHLKPSSCHAGPARASEICVYDLEMVFVSQSVWW